MVEPVDPLKGRKFEAVESALKAYVANDFDLVEPDDRFEECVVTRVPS